MSYEYSITYSLTADTLRCFYKKKIYIFLCDACVGWRVYHAIIPYSVANSLTRFFVLLFLVYVHRLTFLCVGGGGGGGQQPYFQCFLVK